MYCFTCLTLVTNVNLAFLQIVNILFEMRLLLLNILHYAPVDETVYCLPCLTLVTNGNCEANFFILVWDHFCVSKNIILLERGTKVDQTYIAEHEKNTMI